MSRKTWVKVPQGAIVNHLTFTSSQAPAESCDSFKDQYVKRTPQDSWPKLCVLCEKGAATLGAHVSVVVTHEEKETQTCYGLLPCCAGCNNNTRLRQKTYVLQSEDARLALFTKKEQDDLFQVHVRVSKGEPALVCETAGCQRPVCKYNPEKCGGSSRKGCCEHYQLRGKKVGCRVRQALLVAPPPSPAKKDTPELTGLHQSIASRLSEALKLLQSLPSEKSQPPPPLPPPTLGVRDETKGSSPTATT